jgi:hypothetical protein
MDAREPIGRLISGFSFAAGKAIDALQVESWARNKETAYTFSWDHLVVKSIIMARGLSIKKPA